MSKEYWVVGGTYRDITFATLDGAGEAFGPFDSYGDAIECWRKQTSTTTFSATARYSVVATALSPRRPLAAAGNRW